MRLSYGAKIKELLEWTDQMAKSGRENQKQFLLYGLRLVRENFLIYTGNPGITHLTDYEHEWSLKFSRFINGKNVADIYEELNTAFNHISANANPKLVFFDTALKLGKLLTR
jgi:DNA polymerase-3 subunit delta'